MNKKISLGAAVAFMLIVAAAVFAITWNFAESNFNQKSTDLEARIEMYAKFTEVDSVVRENYGDTINETVLMDHVAAGYMKGIGDKYGAYISAEEYKKQTQSKEGEDVGIGAVLEASPGGFLLVKEIYPDSPAQVAGIEEGDLIVKIDDVNLTTENVGKYLSSIQDQPGTKLSLAIRRGSDEMLIPDLTRRAVPIPSVYSRMIADTGAGYILIKQFNDNTADQFTRELHKMIEAGAKCLIFDVRDNIGGSMAAAARMLDRLAPEGVIYSVVSRDGTTEVKASSDANELNLPMVVLTNSGTMGAAELFAQDLKDFGKAKTVGANTAGRGVLRSTIKLSDGSAIELSTSLFNPKSGQNFDGVGVKPDYDVASEGDWTNLDETTDAQLKKALEVVLAMYKATDVGQADLAAAESQAAADAEAASRAAASSRAAAEAAASMAAESARAQSESASESASSSESEPGGDGSEPDDDGPPEEIEPLDDESGQDESTQSGDVQ